VDKDVGWFEVLVDEAAPMQLRERGSDGNGEAQKATRLHGYAKQLFDRLASRILEHQDGTTVLPEQCERSDGPSLVAFTPERVFVIESIEVDDSRMLCRGRHEQDVVESTLGVRVTSTADDALAVIP